MTAKRVLLFTAALVIVLAAAYLAGFWPERTRRIALEGEVAALQQRLAQADAQVRLGKVLGELLQVIETIEAMNYGDAQSLSSRFFEAARTEAGRTTDATIRSVLQAILQNRDAVTAALARGDATVVTTFRSTEHQLRAALGYPVPRTAGP
jgi:hypothetical protein